MLSVLLLIGGPTEGWSGAASAEAAKTDSNVTGCEGMPRAKAGTSGMNHYLMPVDCDTPEQQSCHLTPPHCTSVSVYGIANGSSVPPVQTASHVTALSVRAVYRSPISDVLTPPPEALS
ncbi:hypothetical protein GCM10009113_13190 [Marinobacter szutsaonensis]